MTAALRLLYAQSWKTACIPAIEKWMLKMIEYAEMAKITSSIKDKTLLSFISIWKPFIDSLKEKKGGGELMTYGFDD